MASAVPYGSTQQVVQSKKHSMNEFLNSLNVSSKVERNGSKPFGSYYLVPFYLYLKK
uniref:Uncharacterized protein n=1 Tax=Utricularia reniformis TaxID=192314 RepID=A0A1Y0B0U3_9LAMI|nr:hypothetical protein AEK19_MT0747 [Utricularia reniformis]ART30991.1 hypothetical protein AEK19_MT0747 [Utricularia reniformis]